MSDFERLLAAKASGDPVAIEAAHEEIARNADCDLAELLGDDREDLEELGDELLRRATPPCAFVNGSTGEMIALEGRFGTFSDRTVAHLEQVRRDGLHL